jgi:hypothetical protein
MSSNEPTKMKQLVDAISKRFLKEDQKFANVKEILEAPLTSLKKVDQKTAKLLEEAAFISRIVDLIDLDPSKPFESLMQGRGDVEDPIKFSMLKENIIKRLSDLISTELLRDIIVAARLISRAEKKQDFYIKEKKEQKIMFIGLDQRALGQDQPLPPAEAEAHQEGGTGDHNDEGFQHPHLGSWRASSI